MKSYATPKSNKNTNTRCLHIKAVANVKTAFLNGKLDVDIPQGMPIYKGKCLETPEVSVGITQESQ